MQPTVDYTTEVTGLRYGSVCSGIEAASVAWGPLGWSPAWFAEIEAFPSAVLAHRWPTVPNLGDMRGLPDRVATGEVEAPDVLVGGTPCQAFSVAGRRGSLSDERGALSLAYVELANRIDEVRHARGEPPVAVVWENVPGVLRTSDNAFGCFLAGLAGEAEPLQPPGKRWSNAGCVFGPRRTVAWRVLDAQYFGVAQRRRRVFVVASARNGVDPVAVLFESEGVRRDTAPRREAGQGVTGALTARFGRNGGAAHDDLDGHRLVLGPGGQDLSHAVSARDGKGPCSNLAQATLVAQAVTGDITHALNTANNGKGSSEDGTGRGVPTIAFDTTQVTSALNRSSPRPGDPCHPLSASAHPPAITGRAVRRLMPVECERLQGFPDGHTAVPDWYACSCGHQFPEELGKYGCPDCCGDGRARRKTAADSPRYKVIGNSMAVPCMTWLGARVQRDAEIVTFDLALGGA